jgi:hypothetical protein
MRHELAKYPSQPVVDRIRLEGLVLRSRVQLLPAVVEAVFCRAAKLLMMIL